MEPTVTMIGSEWFSGRQGGLNRYFTDLALNMRVYRMGDTEAFAFGKAPKYFSTLGDINLPLWRRVLAGVVTRRRSVGRRIIDTHFALYGWPLLGSARQISVVHFHGPWAEESIVAGQGRISSNIKRVIEKRVYGKAARIIVLLVAFKEILIKTYGVPADRIVVIPPGVDLSKFAIVERDRPRSGVLVVRRLENRMGIDYLLKAWARIEGSVREHDLTVVGAGTKAAELRSMADELGISHRVNFVGRISDSHLISLYQDAAISVVPSVALEGFGLIAIESLACGLPVIVTDCGGLPEAVGNLDSTLIVSSSDEVQLADRIVEALAGNVPTEGECRDYAEGFTWQRAVEKHDELYRGLRNR